MMATVSEWRRGRDSGWHSNTATDGIQSYDEFDMLATDI